MILASLPRDGATPRLTTQSPLLQLQTPDVMVILRLRKIRRAGQVEAVVPQGLAQQQRAGKAKGKVQRGVTPGHHTAAHPLCRHPVERGPSRRDGNDLALFIHTDQSARWRAQGQLSQVQDAALNGVMAHITAPAIGTVAIGIKIPVRR